MRLNLKYQSGAKPQNIDFLERMPLRPHRAKGSIKPRVRLDFGQSIFDRYYPVPEQLVAT